MRLFIRIFGCLCVCLLATAARAQSVDGFALNRFDPAERGSDWFALESLNRPAPSRFSTGIVFDYAHNPLVLYEEDGDEAAAIVEHQFFVHPGLTVVFFDRLRLAASLPIALVNSGQDAPAGTVPVSPSDGAAVGDLRLGVDVRAAGSESGPARLGLGVQIHTPTGSRSAFTGDGSVRVVPRLLLAGDVGIFAYAARLNFQYRALSDDFAGESFGNEVTFGAAAGVRVIDEKLLLGPEVFGSTVVSDGGDGFFERRTTPLEVLFGGHFTTDSGVDVGLGVGPGLTRGLGAPGVRALGSLEYTPPAEQPASPLPADADADGIRDGVDACPHVPGVAHPDPAKHGCPEPEDRDGDGIVDEEDACPDEPGVENEDPEKNGCPESKDRDGDGILDDVDACPDEPGAENEDPEKHGCPEPEDRDGDGIVDADDACPDEPGPANAEPAKNGCPKAAVVGEKIVITERVEFDTAKASIRPESDAILTAVLEVLEAHPEIKKLQVEGHTDNRGARAFNVDLSRRRAQSVLRWLTAHGVEASRLSSTGLGPDRPIADNDTEEGRQSNRRVEFSIVEREAAE